MPRAPTYYGDTEMNADAFDLTERKWQDLARDCVVSTVLNIEDWEYQTRVGVGREVAIDLLAQWPPARPILRNSDEGLIVLNSLNEVLHGLPSDRTVVALGRAYEEALRGLAAHVGLSGLT
ncbi:MAG: hypothetical protein JSS66_03745 [Armatimonadetes bacterium]|nr:hypothetical protein [Armatimonadota bacterium]